MLEEFVILNRDEIIRRCRAKVAMRSMRGKHGVDMRSHVDVRSPGSLDSVASAWASNGRRTAVDSERPNAYQLSHAAR